MLERNLDIIYNKKYLVIVPKACEDLLDAFEYSFGNTILMNNNIDGINFMIDFINSNNFEQLIFVDYLLEYETIIKSLNRKHEIKIIFTKKLGALSDSYLSYLFYGVYNLYTKYNFSKLAFLDKALYDIMKKNHKNVAYINLDIAKAKKVPEKYDKEMIGILNDQHSPLHSFYNELSAIKLTNHYKVKLAKPNKITRNFLKLFRIKHKITSKNNLHLENAVNLYVNFSNDIETTILKSFDSNTPCILGNTNIFDDYKYLKENLVLKSDDNVNEIAEKIKLVSENRDKILEEYNSFRKSYTEKSKKTIEEFLERKIMPKAKKESKQPLLSIIVPVYNTEQYLRNCLNSILDAGIEDMEILIINDGSTDNSEKIILKYQKNFPKIIRYIKQKNHGLGSVRNLGLKEARGKYIASVDSDDTINIEFLDSALEYLEHDVDIVVYDWLTITNTEKYKTDASDYIFNNDSWNRYEALLYTTIMPSACNKIVKKELFKDLDIKYIEDKFEDLSTTPFVLLKAETIKYINRPYYEYYIRSGSIMRTKPGYSMIDVIKLVDERLKKYNEYINVNIEDFKYYTYSWRIEEYVLNQLYTIDEEEIAEFTKYLNKNFKTIMLDVFNGNKYQEMLEKLPKEYKEYIDKRNKAIKANRLAKFIKDAREKNEYYTITPAIIYYGLKDK